MKFARIIELEDGNQVLYYVESKDNDDGYMIVAKSAFEGGMGTMRFSFKREDNAYKCFEELGLRQAKALRKEMSLYFDEVEA